MVYVIANTSSYRSFDNRVPTDNESRRENTDNHHQEGILLSTAISMSSIAGHYHINAQICDQRQDYHQPYYQELHPESSKF